MSKFAWFCAICFAVASAWAQPAGKLDAAVEGIKAHVANRQGQVFSVTRGDLQNGARSHALKLEKDSNYQIFVAFDRPLEEAQGVLEVYRNARKLPWEGTFGNTECYHWRFMTFQHNPRTTLTLSPKKGEKAEGTYAIVLASAGRETPYDFVRTKSVDAQGKVYELIDNVVYRDGIEFYEGRNRQIASLCVTPDGSLFLLAEDGCVLSKHQGLIWKNSKRKANLMIASRENRAYFLCNDATVLDDQGRIAYKRSDESEAVDLIEDNGCVWIVTREGRRVRL